MKKIRKQTKMSKTMRIFGMSLLAAVVIGAGVAVATLVPAPSAAQSAHGVLDITEVRSDKGITAWLVEDHTLPVISLSFAFKGAGSALDPADRQGLTLLASNTMDEGAGDYDSQTFQKMLADNSIALSFGAGRDDFSGDLKTLTRHAETAFDLLRLAVTQPRFDQEAVDRMRAANIARVRNAVGNPDWIAARIMNDTAFAGHPYALNSGGTLTTLAALSPAELKNFADTRLSRDRLLVTAVGDIDAATLKKRLDEAFGALPAQSPLPPVADLSVQNGGKHVHYDMDIPQTIIEMMQPGISRDDPDYYAATVMDFILGGSGFGSRLTEEVREKRGLTYGINTGFYMMDHLKAYTVSTSTRNETAAEVMDLIRQEWGKMGAVPVSDKELTDAKSYLIGSLPLALSSTDRIADLLLGLRLDGLPIDYLDSRKAKIEAVTGADVQRVAKRLLTPDDLTIVTVGKPENVTYDVKLDTLPNVD
jgi:zinc protease